MFSNNNEPMGNVIFNNELYQILRKKLTNLKLLKTNIEINLENLKPLKKLKLVINFNVQKDY